MRCGFDSSWEIDERKRGRTRNYANPTFVSRDSRRGGERVHLAIDRLQCPLSSSISRLQSPISPRSGAMALTT